MFNSQTLQNIYLNRFVSLTPDVQQRVVETIDSGGSVSTLYDPAEGVAVCILSGDKDEALWTVAITPSEAKVLGEAIIQALNLLPLDHKQAIDDALEDGGRIVAALSHTGEGRMEVRLAHGGETVLIANSKTPPEWAH